MTEGNLATTLLGSLSGVFGLLSGASRTGNRSTTHRSKRQTTDRSHTDRSGADRVHIEILDSDDSTTIEAAAAVDGEPVFAADRGDS